ncbi:MAG: amidase [Sphingomonas sp.]|nr:MAG: amidase [Sphingomonas sp.]
MVTISDRPLVDIAVNQKISGAYIDCHICFVCKRENMLTLVQTADLVRSGSLSAMRVVRDTLDRIERLNPALNAFIRVDAERAEREALEIDRRVARSEDPGPLAGVPIGVKDMEPCAGFPMTEGSWFLRDSPPQAKDSRHVARLRAAGAIVVGITATAEFGMDSATSTSLWGVTRNPWNTDRTPGGSSGGSSAAVAGGLVPLATGTDAGGSIREPASFTGILGLKPSHGRIAKANGFSNWSVHGALVRTAADAARHLDVAAGSHDGDRQSLPDLPYRYEDCIETLDVRRLRACWSADYGFAAVDPEVVEIAHAAAIRLIALAGLESTATRFSATNVYPHMGTLLASTLEADFRRDGILPDGFDKLSPAMKRLLTRIGSRDVDTNRAWSEIRRLEQEVAAFFGQHDLLLSPAAACAPYGAADPVPDVIDGRDASLTGAEPFGMLANVCWNPAISIPVGFTSDGLPVGLQIVGRRHRDDVLLRLARLWERAHPWPFVNN